MVKTVVRLLADDEGTAVIEYALLAGLLFGVCLVLLGSMGLSLKEIYGMVTDGIGRGLH